MKDIIIKHPDRDISLEEIQNNTNYYHWNHEKKEPVFYASTVQALIDKIKELSEKPKEYILCAAIRWDNEAIFKEHDSQYKLVITGRRYKDCYYTLSLTQRERVFLANHTQGFITNLDRFVDRKEAYLIAKAANQIIEPIDHDMGILTSENLY